MSPLTFILGFPFLGALAVAFIPGHLKAVIRGVAVLATLLSLVVALGVFIHFVPGADGPQFTQRVPWVESLGISYFVGVDGLNVGLVFMGAIVAFAAALVSWEIKEREKEFYFLLLVMTGGILGAFASLDLFFFYFFHELALIPTFIMIGVWGRGERKGFAAFQITLYLSVGALLALVGLILLYLEAGANSFDILELTRRSAATPLAAASQKIIFPFLLFGFGILVSLWPFHTWAPLGYGSAPTATAMLHAGVLKKFGVYGLIRVALPLMPQAAQEWSKVIAWLCLGNIFYCGLVAMRQKNFNLLLGNSSVAHMGFVFLGIASLNWVGITGASVVMVAHGLLAALTFGLSGYLYQQTKTLEIDQMGGLLTPLPFIGSLLVMAMLAGCGLPGFANFVGEVMVFFGGWPHWPAFTAIAIWGGLILGGVYMLRAIRNLLHGPLPENWRGVKDASSFWRRLPYLTLLVTLILFGFFPRLLTDKIKPDAGRVVALATRGIVGGAP